MINDAVWARVAADGTLLAASGITGVAKIGVGRYHLTTSQDLTSAGLVATVNSTGGNDPGPGSASVLVGPVDADTLMVRTATPSAGTPTNVDADRPFSVVGLL